MIGTDFPQIIYDRIYYFDGILEKHGTHNKHILGINKHMIWRSLEAYFFRIPFLWGDRPSRPRLALSHNPYDFGSSSGQQPHTMWCPEYATYCAQQTMQSPHASTALYPRICVVHLSVCLSVCLSGWLAVCLSVCLSVCLYVCMRACMHACMHACMSVHKVRIHCIAHTAQDSTAQHSRAPRSTAKQSNAWQRLAHYNQARPAYVKVRQVCLLLAGQPASQPDSQQEKRR